MKISKTHNFLKYKFLINFFLLSLGSLSTFFDLKLKLVKKLWNKIHKIWEF